MNIAKHNVCGFNDSVKRALFINYVNTNNIDIVGHWSSDGMRAGVAILVSK
ncbi:3248_t:CDS:2, partial [Diversispora eburnea]